MLWPRRYECGDHEASSAHRLLDLHELFGGDRRLRGGADGLRGAPVVHVRHLMDAGDGAVRRAAFFGEELAADVVDGVLLQRNGGRAALLRAIVHQAVLADIEIACAGAASPVIGLAVGDIVLEPVHARIVALVEFLHLQKDLALALAQRTKLAIAVVNDADGGGEAELDGAASDDQRVLRVVDAAADNRIDIDVKLGVLGQQLQLLVEHLQRLLRDLVGHDVVDGDLQVVEAGVVEALDAIGGEQIAVSDHAGNHALPANVPNDLVEVGMQQRLAAAEGDDRGAQSRQMIDARLHRLQRHGLGEVIVLIAILAGEIAAADGYDVRQDGVVGRAQPPGDDPQLTNAPFGNEQAPALGGFRHSFQQFLLQHKRFDGGNECRLSGDICDASGSSWHPNRHRAPTKMFYVEQFPSS